MIRIDDVDVGFEFGAGPYLVTRSEIMTFALIWDPQPFHIDEHAAKLSTFGSVIACSAHMFAIYSKLAAEAHERKPIAGFIAGLSQEQRLVNAAKDGDSLSLDGHLAAKRVSDTDSRRVVVKAEMTLNNQHGKTMSKVTAFTLWQR